MLAQEGNTSISILYAYSRIAVRDHTRIANCLKFTRL